MTVRDAARPAIGELRTLQVAIELCYFDVLPLRPRIRWLESYTGYRDC